MRLAGRVSHPLAPPRVRPSAPRPRPSPGRIDAQLPDLLLGVRSGNLGDLSLLQLAQIDKL
jgi:hypothetical protein